MPEPISSAPNDTSSQKGKKLLDQYRDALRIRHYSPRTEDTYIQWVRNYILFHNKRHPKEMGIPEIGQYLIHLATKQQVAASTPSSSSIVTFFTLAWMKPASTSSAPQRGKTVPTVLSKQEIKRVFENMTGIHKLIAQVMYDGGLRIMDAMRLRVKDIDFDNHQIIVREGKGENDRLTMLPDAVIQPLQLHLRYVKSLHEKDLADGFGCVYLPNALERKYKNADKDWIWQYLFPAPELSKDQYSGIIRRHHLHESTVQKAVKEAARLAKINKPVTPHTFRHSFTTHLIQSGYDTQHLRSGQVFALFRNSSATRT
jgi:integron integrase